jgi:hypothetical protein
MDTQATSAAALTRGNDVLVQNNVLFNSSLGLGPSGQDITWRANVIFADAPPLVQIEDLEASATTFTATGNRFYSPTDPSSWFSIPEPASFGEWQRLTGETGSDQAVLFEDSLRSLSSYSESLGSNPWSQAFFMETLAQAKFSYRAGYTAPALLMYLRQGFTLRAP